MIWKDFIALRELSRGKAPHGKEPCRDCQTPLQEIKTGCHHCLDGKHVCSRCYYKAIGGEIDENPIGVVFL
jgi:hypothetical protein